MSQIKIVKKLSMKVLVGNVKPIVKPLANGDSVELAKVIGIARGIKRGSSTFGDWEALTGEFVAEASIGDKKGIRYRTATLFLPSVALDMVTAIVENSEKGAGVELAFSIGAEADENSTTGYIYTASFLVEPSSNDPLEALMNKALPAPEPASNDPLETLMNKALSAPEPAADAPVAKQDKKAA